MDTPLCSMTEQEDITFRKKSRTQPMPSTTRAPFLCLAMKPVVLLVSSTARFADFAVTSDALTVPLADFPAFAARYSFLMARFCCQRE